MFGFGGHLGDRASALVDGQLPADQEEQAWAHAMHCQDCRRLIEREGWLKSRLRGLAYEPASESPRPGLLGQLYDVRAWADADAVAIEDHSHQIGIMLAAAGSLGAAVIGLIMLTGAPTQEPIRPAQINLTPTTSLGGDPLRILDPFRPCGTGTDTEVAVTAAIACPAQ